jgi:hypothetical protein
VLYLLLTFELLLLANSPSLQSKPSATFDFDSSIITAQDGYIQIIWSGSSEYEMFELQQSQDPNFTTEKTIYLGPDRASFVSGLSEGSHFFRVRSEGGPWSETLEVRAKHQSIKLAYWLMLIGSIVFLATCAVVISGARQKPVIKTK